MSGSTDLFLFLLMGVLAFTAKAAVITTSACVVISYWWRNFRDR